ncbi:MAG: hypothetical protein ACO3H5_06475, partial [Candidatus Nanopelagicales bacterium]
NYYQIPNDPRNTLLNLLKDQNKKNEEKDEEEKKRNPVASTPRQRAKSRASGESITLPKPTVPVIQEQEKVLPLVIQPTLETQGLLTEKEQKEIAKDPATLNKYTKAGDFFARAGGFRYPSPTQEQMQQLSPEQLDLFNKQRLAARNKGIGEMLLMLSDALGGKDVAMRALERQQARQPKEKSVSEIRSSILSKLMIPGGKISRTEFNTLVGIDPNYRDLAITNPELFDFTDDESGVPQGFSGTPDQWNLLKESNPDKPDEDLIKYFNENYGV